MQIVSLIWINILLIPLSLKFELCTSRKPQKLSSESFNKPNEVTEAWSLRSIGLKKDENISEFVLKDISETVKRAAIDWTGLSEVATNITKSRIDPTLVTNETVSEISNTVNDTIFTSGVKPVEKGVDASFESIGYLWLIILFCCSVAIFICLTLMIWCCCKKCCEKCCEKCCKKCCKKTQQRAEPETVPMNELDESTIKRSLEEIGFVLQFVPVVWK